jgi:hypothetical protein
VGLFGLGATEVGSGGLATAGVAVGALLASSALIGGINNAIAAFLPDKDSDAISNVPTDPMQAANLMTGGPQAMHMLAVVEGLVGMGMDFANVAESSGLDSANQSTGATPQEKSDTTQNSLNAAGDSAAFIPLATAPSPDNQTSPGGGTSAPAGGSGSSNGPITVQSLLNNAINSEIASVSQYPLQTQSNNSGGCE